MTDIHEALANPEANGPGYDAQTRPAGQPGTVNRTDPYGSAEHITVARTPPDYAERAEYKPTSTTEGGRPMTDQLEDAKLGRALRELDEALPEGWVWDLYRSATGLTLSVWEVENPHNGPNAGVAEFADLHIAITAARRALEDDR